MALRDKKTRHEWEGWSSPPSCQRSLKCDSWKESDCREEARHKHSAQLVSMAFQEWRAFFNHLCLSFLTTPSRFPTDPLLTHKLAPPFEFFQTWIYLIIHQVAAMTPMECVMFPTKRWNFKCARVQELARIKQVSATPDWLLPAVSTHPTALWVCWTRQAVKLRALEHQSLSSFQLHGHRPVRALGQSSPSLTSLWMTVGPWLLQSAVFGLPDAGDLLVNCSFWGRFFI